MDLFQSKIAYCMIERLQDSFILKDCLILSFYAIFDWNKSILLTREIDQIFQVKEPSVLSNQINII